MNNFFRSVAFDLASQQIIDIEHELLAFALILEAVLGYFDEVANGVDYDLMGGFLNSAFEEEVVGDFRFSLDEL